jgi:hypothetical protein
MIGSVAPGMPRLGPTTPFFLATKWSSTKLYYPFVSAPIDIIGIAACLMERVTTDRWPGIA